MAVVLANHHLWDAIAFKVYTWAVPRAPYIQQAFLQKGGWEGWLQVELGLFLKTDNHTFQVAREQRPFTTNQKADIVWLADFPGNPGETIRHRNVIELKCESQYQDCVLNYNNEPLLVNGLPQAKDTNSQPIDIDGNTPPTIANRLRRDILKGQNISAGLNTQFSVIGFSNTPEAKAWAVRQSNNIQHTNFEFAPLEVDNQSLLMWYYKKHYP